MRRFSGVTLATGGAIALTIAALPFAVSGIAAAETSTDDTVQTQTSDNPATTGRQRAEEAKKKAELAKQQAEQRMKEAQERAQALKQQMQQGGTGGQGGPGGKLTGGKLDLCKKREAQVTQLMGRIGDRGQKQLDTITTISDRVQKFYNDKNLNISDYVALTQDIETKKADAQKAVDALKAAAPDFKCDGTDPKGSAAVFQELMKAQNEALKAYREAVIKLLVAVKQAAGSTTPSPTPPTTPEPVAPTNSDNGGQQ